MVTIKNFKAITKSDGEKFFALIVEGGVQPVKSQNTGRIYFTTRSATVPTTFDEAICKQVIGEAFNGDIVKVDCEPYDYTIEQTGEVIQLSHRWEYKDEALDVMENMVVKKNQKIK
ncbi:hypothetical protein [Mangrovimonas sp. ST2L15]|uniref:hypothetical protein n=1 Tax=Mangrovimonas sp. ST2L15 TaxID=1645916 RepID=UPI0006B411A7|nr:hypothetical protein [Mangrovimonas sp. ST2L15]